ncbi:MAG TPA: hypothetical protein ENI66_00470 [Candidatus Yonathbacteria bacterium]|nr:hypothetical protein [Candidatus Yonathbacteria bacterium]
MKILDLIQNTPEWSTERRGKITGTKLSKVMGTPLNKIELISELIAEVGTEQTKHMGVSEKMRRGTEEEPMSLKSFEKTTGKKVTSVGFCISDEFSYLGLSPDGLISDVYGDYTEAVEIKNPDSSTLIKYKLANMIEEKELGLTPAKRPFLGIPEEYKYQTLNYFLVNEKLRKLHFVTHDERFISGDMKTYIVELNRENEVLQKELDRIRKALVLFRETWMKWQEIVLPTGF